MTTSCFALPATETQVRTRAHNSQQHLPTGHFPRDVSRLERSELEEVYQKLRFHYKGVMISRGIHQKRCHRQADQLQDLAGKLRSLMLEQARDKAQTYALLEQISDVAQALEADGDGLATSFQQFRRGGHPYGGAPRIGNLIQAVIQFINNWQHHKRAFRQLIAEQQARAALTAASEPRR